MLPCEWYNCTCIVCFERQFTLVINGCRILYYHNGKQTFHLPSELELGAWDDIADELTTLHL